MIRIEKLKSILAMLMVCTCMVVIAFLSGCGQKGPLYLPAEQLEQDKEQTSQGN